MKKVVIFLTVIFLISLMSKAIFAQSGDAIISGKVTDMKTGKPLVKAFVMAEMLGGRNMVTRTDSWGFYQLNKLSTGLYELSAFAFGYYLMIYPETLEVNPGDSIIEVNFGLYTPPTGAISGMVTDSASGEPVANAKIFVHNISGCEKSLAYTDSVGFYYIEKLQEGFYRASAFARSYKPLKYTVPIEVVADSVSSDVNFKMIVKGNQREGKIFGQVRDQDSGLPIPFASVIAYSGFEYIHGTVADEDGKYVLEDLPITPYKVMAVHEGYISEYYREAMYDDNAIEVTPTTPNIDFALTASQEGFLNLGGRINSDGKGISNVSIYAFSESGEIVASAVSDFEGEYVIENLLPGEYFLLTTSPHGNKQGPSVKLKFKDFCGADINIGKSGVEENSITIPKDLSLNQNYPNPFNPVTVISFSLKAKATTDNNLLNTNLVVYDILGRKVRTLLDADMSPGDYQVKWDGKNDKGDKVSSGIYFYRLTAGDYSETKEMIMLK